MWFMEKKNIYRPPIRRNRVFSGMSDRKHKGVRNDNKGTIRVCQEYGAILQ